jgi:uncharacterized protein (DUF58 family)
MNTYLHADTIARAEALGIQARTVVEGLRVGDHKSPYRGFSVEFVQHREYVPGDDLRHIDWRVYGRAERYTIKQYEQETNFISHILLDGSKSMLYGDGPQNKLEYAKLLAATLAFVVVHQRDSAGLNVSDTTWRLQVPPSSQPGQIHNILRALVNVKPAGPTAIGPLLHELAEKVRRRGLVFLISDCFDNVEKVLGGLRHLRFGGHEVTLFHVLHADEVDFPFEGMVKFDGLEEKLLLRTRPQLIRPAYLKALQKFLTELQAGCEAEKVDYVRLVTARPLMGPLSEYLHRRQRIRRL